VKQSDLGEYGENAREGQNIQYTRQSTNSPSNQGKSQAPPQTKANQIKRQTQQKTPTPPEVENTRFHQLRLDIPQDKHRLLKQQSKSKHI
jgi:hypothetical protein